MYNPSAKGYSDFHNLMGFASKKMPNNILFLPITFLSAKFSHLSKQFQNQRKILHYFDTHIKNFWRKVFRSY